MTQYAHCMCFLFALFAASMAQLMTGARPFGAFNVNSTRAPAAMQSLAGFSNRHCTLLCEARADCFGFYWIQGLCNLFNMSAFLDQQTWISSEQSGIFTAPRKLQIGGCVQMSNLTHENCPGSTCVCSLGIDGNTSRYFSSGSCTHTAQNSNGPWWEARLSAESFISYVTLYNRDDCCGSRLNQFSLQVDGVECRRVNLVVPFSVASFPCMKRGSKVRVVSLLTNDALTICEFEAYGLP